MDMRTIKNGWVTIGNDNYSLLKGNRVYVDLEYKTKYWRIVYYLRSGDKVRLQFEFENINTPLEIIMRRVEIKLKGTN